MCFYAETSAVISSDFQRNCSKWREILPEVHFVISIIIIIVMIFIIYIFLHQKQNLTLCISFISLCVSQRGCLFIEPSAWVHTPISCRSQTSSSNCCVCIGFCNPRLSEHQNIWVFLCLVVCFVEWQPALHWRLSGMTGLCVIKRPDWKRRWRRGIGSVWAQSFRVGGQRGRERGR